MTKESEIKEGTSSQEAHRSSKDDLSERSADHSATKNHDHDTRSDEVSGDDSVQPQENQHDMTVIARTSESTCEEDLTDPMESRKDADISDQPLEVSNCKSTTDYPENDRLCAIEASSAVDGEKVDPSDPPDCKPSKLEEHENSRLLGHLSENENGQSDRENGIDVARPGEIFQSEVADQASSETIDPGDDQEIVAEKSKEPALEERLLPLLLPGPTDSAAATSSQSTERLDYEPSKLEEHENSRLLGHISENENGESDRENGIDVSRPGTRFQSEVPDQASSETIDLGDDKEIQAEKSHEPALEERLSPPLLPGPTDSAAATSSQSTERLDHEASNSGSRGGAMANAQPQKSYDYLLKVLLVGDSDVGKQEILSNLEDGIHDSPFCSSEGAAYKTTIILIDGKRVKLQLWDTSGQGRFCTIIRSYSRGAQGILLVYDITNKWSFEGISRWLHEVDHYAPGIPKVLVGNRLHLAFKRQVHQEEAEEYAERNSMGFIEVSPLVNFNISETFVELARMALKRNGMERLWRSNKVSSLYELCAMSIVNSTTVYDIDRLPLPAAVKQNLKSYAVTNYSISQANQKYLRRPGSVALHRNKSQKGGGGGPGGSGHRRTFSSGSADHLNTVKAALTPSSLLRRRLGRRHHHHHLANTPADAANVSCGPSSKGCTIS